MKNPLRLPKFLLSFFKPRLTKQERDFFKLDHRWHMKKIFTILCILISLSAFANSPKTVYWKCGNYGYYAPLVSSYYVDPAAGGSQNGSFANPWHTISQVNSAMGSLNPGDFVSFKRGERFYGRLNVTASGSSGSPITFQPYGTGTDTCVFQFSNSGVGTSGSIVHITGDYITIDGFKLTDTLQDPNDKDAEALTAYGFDIDNASHTIIKNSTVSKVGVGCSMVGDNNLFTTSKIFNLFMVRNDGTADNDYGANAFVVTGSNNTASYSLFQDCWANSIDYGSDGGVFEQYGINSNNKLIYSSCIRNDGVMEVGGTAGNVVTDLQVAYCKLINNGLLSYLNVSGTFGVNPYNIMYWNNTIVESTNQFSRASIFQYGGTPDTDTAFNLKNNIIYLSANIDVMKLGNDASKYIHQNNIYYLPGGGSINYSAGGSEFTVDPLFTSTSGSPNGWNYTPQAISNAIGNGQNLGFTVDFAGNAVPNPPTIGILQRGSTPAGCNCFHSRKKYLNRS